jgi:hypothetical protein
VVFPGLQRFSWLLVSPDARGVISHYRVKNEGLENQVEIGGKNS